MSRRFRSALSVLGAVALISPWGLSQQLSAQNASGSAQLGQAVASDADGYIKNADYPKLARTVIAMPESPSRDYFAGVLANREGRIAESISLLTKVRAQLEASQPNHAVVALSSLADDYMKSFRYRDAIQAYEDLLHKVASQMDKQERQSADDDYRVAVLLKNAPPQTISFDGSVDVITHRNPVLDTIETTLKVNGVTQSWILDTGANLSTVSASFAHKLGVQLSKGSARTQGITGAENKLHVAIVPELKLGNATVHNVVLLVLPDKNLNVPTGEKTHSQIDAILGYPVMQALGRVTFTSDGHFLGGPDSPSSENGARLLHGRVDTAVGVRGREPQGLVFVRYRRQR
jgi:predicted aspartyl protease